MPKIEKDDFVHTLFDLLVETFESPSQSSSIYLDQKTGLFETLNGISAEQASAPIAQGATTIAAQVEHIRFYMDVIEQFMNGRTQKVDWQESWQVRELSPKAWQTLQQDLRTAYENLTNNLKNVEIWGNDEITDSLAAAIHTAYHLGAIRQMVHVVQGLELT